LAPALPGPFFFARRELDWNSAIAPADLSVSPPDGPAATKRGAARATPHAFRLELTLAQVEALIPALPDRNPR
jgi:hypothetical protein